MVIADATQAIPLTMITAEVSQAPTFDRQHRRFDTRLTFDHQQNRLTFDHRSEHDTERELCIYVRVCVRTCVRACVRARVCARTRDYVTFVFIDEVFGVCVCDY